VEGLVLRNRRNISIFTVVFVAYSTSGM